MVKPTYDELLDLLDNVSAALENAVLAPRMTEADRISRGLLARTARTICDQLLRPTNDDDDED